MATKPLIFMKNRRKRQESNLPKTPARPPTGLKPARPTGSGTLPIVDLAGFFIIVNYLSRSILENRPPVFHFFVPVLFQDVDCRSRRAATIRLLAVVDCHRERSLP